MQKHGSTDDPALFPIENPNPVLRAAADGRILFANPASGCLLAAWGARVGGSLPAEWQTRVAEALSSETRQRAMTRCGELTFELDLVPIRPRDYVNLYGRDVTEQEAARRAREALLAELQRERDLQQTLMEHTLSLALDNARHLETESQQRRLAEQRAAELGATLDAISDGVIIYDRAGKIVRQNEAAARMLGFGAAASALTMSERQQRVQAVLVDDPAAGPDALAGARALRGETVRSQLISLQTADNPDAPRTYISASAAPIRDREGRQLGAVASFSDVTELRRARDELAAQVEALRRSEEQARDLIRYAATGIYEVDFRTGRFRAVNDAMCGILGYSREELVGMSAFDLLDDEGKARFADRMRRTLAGEKIDPSVEYRVMKRNGEMIYGVLSIRITYHAGQPDGAFVIAHDVTERRRAAEALQEAKDQLELRVQERTAELSQREATLEAIFASIPDALYVADETGIVRCNQAALDSFGCDSSEELRAAAGMLPEQAQARYADTGRPIPPDDLPVARALRGERCVYEAISQNLKTQQDLVHRSAAAPIWLNGKIIGAVGIATDITEQKRMEQELRAGREQLQNLAHRLVRLQETERSYVANELYNDEGQRLAALLLELGHLHREAGGNPALETRIAHLQHLADGILSDLHSLAVNLRPASLDRLGLVPALSVYAEELGRRHGLNVQVVVHGPERLTLPPDTETMLYRIAQEAVTNAVRHSGAGQVAIVGVLHEEKLILLVEDDGAGFDAAEAVRCGGLGIVGMRERAEMLGGKLTIESTAGKGTSVYIEVPLRQA